MGLDWEQEIRQRAREMELLRQLGLPVESPASASAAGAVEDLEEIVNAVS